MHSPLFFRFSLARIAPQPWRNGRGQTREIAAGRLVDGAGHREWDWRVSVACIACAGEFSRFEGVQRTAVLVKGSDLALTGGARRLQFRRVGDVRSFGGEEPLRSLPGNDGASLLNVMCVRGRSIADVAVRSDEECLALEGHTVRIFYALAGRSLLLISEGRGQPGRHLRLGPGEGVRLDRIDGAAHFHPASTAGRLVDIRIEASGLAMMPAP